jgi:hypothetical protein
MSNPAEISLERSEISLTGIKISPYKHSGTPVGQVAGMDVHRYCRELFLGTGKQDEIFSYI